MRERAVYIISVAAELSGVHPQTLRTYERVLLIQELTQGDGINLAGVLRILALQDRIEQMEDRLERARAEIEDVKAQARQALREIQASTRHEIVLYRAPEIERHPSARRRRG